MCEVINKQAVSTFYNSNVDNEDYDTKVCRVAAGRFHSCTTNSTLEIGRVANSSEAQLQDIVNSFTSEESAYSNIAAQDPQLCYRVILALYELLWRLDIKFQELERIGRRDERNQQLEDLKKIVDNHQDLGKFLFQTGLGSGFFGIVSGFLPIIGHMKGRSILGIFSKLPFMSDLEKFKTDKQIHMVFKGLSTAMHSGSQITDTTGKIRQTFSEGDRTFYNQMTDLHRSETEENTRGIDELRQDMRAIENFYRDYIQAEQELTRLLYS